MPNRDSRFRAMGGNWEPSSPRAGHEAVFRLLRGNEKLKRLARDAQGEARAGGRQVKEGRWLD
jgi:hypothetical protein